MNAHNTNFLSELLESNTRVARGHAAMDRAYASQCEEVRVVNTWQAQRHEAIFIEGDILPLLKILAHDPVTFWPKDLAVLIRALDAGASVFLVNPHGHFSLHKVPSSADTFDRILGRKTNWTAASLDCTWWRIWSLLGNDVARIATSRTAGSWLCNITMIRESATNIDAVAA